MSIFRIFSVLSCPNCGGRMYREGRSFDCGTCSVVARPDIGAWRYPLESEFRHRLPGALGSSFEGHNGEGAA